MWLIDDHGVHHHQMPSGDPWHVPRPTYRLRSRSGSLLPSVRKSLSVDRGSSAGASDLVEESELSAEDRTALRATFPDLVSDSPQTTVAVSRFKRIIAKAGPAA